MDRLTAETLRSISNVDYADKGYPLLDPDVKLSLEIDRAVVWLEWATGRAEVDYVDGSNDAIMWTEATQLLTEMRVNHREQGYTDAIHSDAQEITVTGYSERRISNAERTPARSITYLKELDDILWMLMTEDKRTYWIDSFTKMQAPLEIIDEFDSSMDEVNPWYL